MDGTTITYGTSGAEFDAITCIKYTGTDFLIVRRDTLFTILTVLNPSGIKRRRRKL